MHTLGLVQLYYHLYGVCMYLQAGAVLAQSTRHVSLHEHHSMELMGSFGISVPYGEVAVTADQAKDITHRLGRHSLTLYYCCIFFHPEIISIPTSDLLMFTTSNSWPKRNF